MNISVEGEGRFCRDYTSIQANRIVDDTCMWHLLYFGRIIINVPFGELLGVERFHRTS